MRKIREVLRLKYEQGRSQRQIQAATGLSKGSVGEYLRRAERAGLTWPMAEPLSDAELETRLFRQIGRNEPAGRTPIDFGWVHKELRRTGVTLQQLCVEYQQAAVDAHDGRRPYQYSQFCDLYHEWRSKLDVPMRQTHRAGEKGFIDYSGKKPKIVEPQTGEVIEVELYVLVLGASNYTYAEATLTQKLGDFLGSTVRSLEYFGAVPQMLVPDQLKSAVAGADWYDPDINPAFFELARHYDTAIIPARPGKPRDKAKVEAGVLIAQRWISARLRNRTFFSLAALNEAIAELLEELNARPFQKLEGCRRSAFESIDRPAMHALPARRYEQSDWKKAKVNVDYHATYDDRHYSAPCALIGAAVYVRATRSTIEILHGGERVASHQRCFGPKGTYTTCEEHKPKSHRDYASGRLLGCKPGPIPSVHRWGASSRASLAGTAIPSLASAACWR